MGGELAEENSDTHTHLSYGTAILPHYRGGEALTQCNSPNAWFLSVHTHTICR